MNDSRHVEDLFSERFDDTLIPADRAAFDAHLRACGACRTGYDAFQRSTSALRGLRLAPTSPAHVHDVQRAIAGAERRRWRPWAVLSHAAAALVGLAIALGFRGCAEPRAIEVVREVPVEVPVEVVREVPVEVPVEVVREVPVEVVREVPVERIEYVDRPVPGPPAIDAERTYRLLGEISGALLAVARAEGRARAAEAPELATVAAAPAETRPRTDTDPGPTSAPLRIVRTGDQVRIRTRGTPEEVFPALIDMLEDPDEEVARAVEHHLEALRAELSGDASLEPLVALRTDDARAPVARPGGLRGLLASDDDPEEPAPTEDAHAHWTRWWLAQGPAMTRVAANTESDGTR